MPFSLTTFLNQAGGDPLHRYVVERVLPWPDDFDWDAPSKRFASQFIAVLNDLPDEQRQLVERELQQVSQLEGELGQQILRDHCERDFELMTALKQLATDQARGLAVLLHRPDLFERSSIAASLDRRHGSACHETFKFRTDRDALDTDDAKEALRSAAEDIYRRRLKVKRQIVIDFARRKSGHRGGDGVAAVMQLTIYQEADTRSAMVFDGHELQPNTRRDAKLGAITYDPGSGELSIIAPGGRQVIEQLASAFKRHIFGGAAEFEPVPRVQYELSRLKRPIRFDVDAGDPIASVELVSLELYGAGSEQLHVTLRKPDKASGSLLTGADRLFGPGLNPLRDPMTCVRRAEILVTFEAAAGE